MFSSHGRCGKQCALMLVGCVRNAGNGDVATCMIRDRNACISKRKSAITPILDPFIFIGLASIKVGNLFKVDKSETAGSPLT